MICFIKKLANPFYDEDENKDIFPFNIISRNIYTLMLKLLILDKKSEEDDVCIACTILIYTQ